MNKSHSSHCPLCPHPDIAEMEKLYGGWVLAAELIEMFDLVGPEKTYEDKTAAFRGIKRHMNASGTPERRREKNMIGLLQWYARNGARAISNADPKDLVYAGQWAAAKLGEIMHERKQPQSNVLLVTTNQSDVQLAALIRAAAQCLPPPQPMAEAEVIGDGEPDGAATEFPEEE